MKTIERQLRELYVDSLLHLGAEYPNLVVLDSDLAASTGSAKFGKKYPERFFDCGIQEANMTGVAAGLSVNGMIPIIHSFCAFTGRRITDQVFLSCAYAGANVRIIGADPGICAAKNGGTHMALEDMGILRTIPNVTIIDPCDGVSLNRLLHQSVETPGVYYFRLNRKANYRIYSEDADIRIGHANTVHEGKDITLIAEGTICVPEAIQAAELLLKDGISARVLDMSTIKPLDKAAVLRAAQETGGILTIENHNIINGLGSAVAEILAENQAAIPFNRLGIPDVFGQVGTVQELQTYYGLTAVSIAEKAKKLLNH